MDAADPKPRGESARTRRLLGWARFVALALPIAWLARRTDPGLITAAIRTVGWAGFAGALVSQAASVATGALRWRWLLRAYGATPAQLPTRATLFRHSLVGLYFAMLPSGLVGEVVRARRTEDVLPSAADAYVVALLDRISGAVGLLVLAAASVLASPVYASDPRVIATLRIVAVLTLVVSLGMVGLPFVLERHAGLRQRLGRVPLVGPKLASLTPPVHATGLLAAMALSLLTQALTVVTLAVIVAPLAHGLSLASLVAPLPTIILLTFFPITPGGVGQRELVFVSFLAPLGIGASDATAASLVTMSMTLTLAAFGGALFAWDAARDRRAASDGAALAPPAPPSDS